jgi:hypothetical protein
MAADGVQLCPGGRAWDLGLERCEACPPGKQSRDNSTMPCSFCPQTLMPNSNQSGCVCQPLHFNVWTSSIGSHNELLECTPCASVLVALAQGEEATDNANIGKQPCLPCVDMNSPSCTMGSCECAGGPKGDARLCPGDGYWLEYTKGEIGADFDPGEDMPEDKSNRSSSFEMLECSLPVGGGQSRCLHWSRCLEAADTGPEGDDPNEVATSGIAPVGSVESLHHAVHTLRLQASHPARYPRSVRDRGHTAYRSVPTSTPRRLQRQAPGSRPLPAPGR